MIRLVIDSDKRLRVLDKNGTKRKDLGDYLLFFGENDFEEIELSCPTNIHGNIISHYMTELVAVSDEEHRYPVTFENRDGTLVSETIFIGKEMTASAGEVTVYVSFTASSYIGKTDSVRFLIRSNICPNRMTGGTLSVSPKEEVQEFSTPSGYRRVEVAAVDAEALSVSPIDAVQVFTPTRGKYYNKVTVKKPDLPLQDLSVTPSSQAQTVTADEDHFALRSVRVEPISSALDLEVKRATPSTEPQVITPDGEYVGLSEVRVDPVTASVDRNLIPMNIRKDVTVLGVTGEMESVEVIVEDEDDSIPLARFYDYDGTLLSSYTAQELNALSAPPEPPSHAGLRFVGYNRSLESMKRYLSQKNTFADAGAVYDTSDGHTRLYLSVGGAEGSDSLTVTLCFGFSDAQVAIDWGDSQVENVISNDVVRTFTHTYAQSGHYTIDIQCVSGALVLGSRDNSGSRITDDRRLIRKVELGSNCSLSHQAFRYCHALETVTLSSALTQVKNYAFAECHSLKFAVLPELTSGVGSYSFDKCYALKGAVLPDSVTVLNNYAFYSCTSLDHMMLPEGLYSIYENCFMNCYNLKELYLGESLGVLSRAAFSNCMKLTAVVIPSTLSEIGQDAFNSCIGLRAIALPDSVTAVGNSAFFGCTGVRHLRLSENLEQIGNNAFSKINIRELSLPDSVVRIGTSAFSELQSMTELTLSTSAELYDSIFHSCSALTTLTLDIREVTEGIFNNSKSLRYVTFSSRVDRIGDFTFADCPTVSRLCIPPSVNYIGSGWIDQCAALREVDLSDHTAPPQAADGAFGSINASVRFFVKDEATRALFVSAPNWSQIAQRIVVKDA